VNEHLLNVFLVYFREPFDGKTNPAAFEHVSPHMFSTSHILYVKRQRLKEALLEADETMYRRRIAH